MTTTFPTEEMKMERSAALARIRKQQYEEEIRLRREMDQAVWRDWVFWLGVLFLGDRFRQPGASESPWPLGLVLLIVALDRVARRRARAARDLTKLESDKNTFVSK